MTKNAEMAAHLSADDTGDTGNLRDSRGSGAAPASGPGGAGRARGRPSRQSALTRQDWVAAARELLIAGGVENVRIGRLAETLNVTRGGFYWLFKTRDELLSELLLDWQRTNTLPFERILNGEHNGLNELLDLLEVWITEKDYSPDYDSAIRDWARNSEEAATVVKKVDIHRIDLMKRIFLDLGFADDEAYIRARIAYFHQVGYYILGLGESTEYRTSRRYLALHLKVLADIEEDDADLLNWPR
jgi:AcrR family transcriptional regulator